MLCNQRKRINNTKLQVISILIINNLNNTPIGILSLEIICFSVWNTENPQAKLHIHKSPVNHVKYVHIDMPGMPREASKFDALQWNKLPALNAVNIIDTHNMIISGRIIIPTIIISSYSLA